MASSNGGSSPPTPPDVPPELEAALREALQPSFLLVRCLGSGGMGTVWLARDPILKRLVAVKVLARHLAQDTEARARFEREAQAVAGLSHPNVVSIYGVGALPDGTPYFVMQYVSGRSLAARLSGDGPPDVAEARRLVGEVASALAAAHSKGIIHRDIKPANILYDDESRRALVSDFGIAAVRPADGPANDARLTQTGMAIGTPLYMSPEQVLAERPTDKSDMYALGLVAHELVTGAPVFKARTPQELMAAHLRDVPPRLAAAHPHIDPEFDTLVAQCLAKNPDERPTADDVAKRLTPGARLLLEWPPPGLEALHGRARAWERRIAVASTLIVGPALAFMLIGPYAGSAFGSPLALLLIVVALSGSVLMVRALMDVWRTTGRAIEAGAHGYTWNTLIETAADARGDTGALITGSREYTGLDANTRGELRRQRLVHAASSLGAAILPVPMLFVGVWLSAAVSMGAGFVTLVVLAPIVALVAFRARARRAEEKTVSATRAGLVRRRAPRDVTARLVAPWYASFDSAGEGQNRERGSAARPWVVRAAAIAGVGVIVVALTALLPVWMLVAAGPAVGEGMLQAGNVVAKLRITNPVRKYALPPDSAITPERAGQAMHAIAMRGGRVAESMEREPVAVFPPWPRYSAALFPDTARAIGDWPHPYTILARAKAGLSAAQNEYLSQLAANPIWKELEIVARAPHMDYAGARYRLPFSPGVSPFALPIPRFAGTKEVAYANTSRAAWHLANGRLADAERVLRETISFGFHLVDDGLTLIEMLYGVVIVGIGRGNLIEFYTLTGNPEGPRLSAAIAASQPSGSDLGLAVIDIRADPRATAMHMLTDSALPRGARSEMLVSAGALSCTNLQELLFGPSAELRSAQARAFSQIARSAGDSAVLELNRRAADRDVDWHVLSQERDPNWRERAFMASANASAMLLRNQRIARCAKLTAIARYHLTRVDSAR